METKENTKYSKEFLEYLEEILHDVYKYNGKVSFTDEFGRFYQIQFISKDKHKLLFK